MIKAAGCQFVKVNLDSQNQLIDLQQGSGSQ
jgi:hypothetical protein